MAIMMLITVNVLYISFINKADCEGEHKDNNELFCPRHKRHFLTFINFRQANAFSSFGK